MVNYCGEWVKGGGEDQTKLKKTEAAIRIQYFLANLSCYFFFFFSELIQRYYRYISKKIGNNVVKIYNTQSC